MKSKTIIERITKNRDANEQLLYFTSSSLFSDDNQLIFISDITGHPNLFHLNLLTGKDTQLTDNNRGYLKSYVYFDGNPYKGLGKASVSLHSPSGTLYYIDGLNICSVNKDGRVRVVAEYPRGQMTAFTHVSVDGSLLCLPTTDAEALDGDNKLQGKPPYDIDRRVREKNLCSYLRVYDTRTGKEVLREKIPRAWVTHVQFSPKSNNLILYNHEWPSDCGIRRMWLWDGNQHIRLRTENENRSRLDWTCHEMWERSGEGIIYHGAYKNGPAYLGRINSGRNGITEIPLPSGWTRYGHFTTGNDGTMISDGYYQKKSDKKAAFSPWISRIKINWNDSDMKWAPVCRHGSSFNSQDSHPHPIFDHKAKWIYFTSDKDGKTAVFRIKAI